LAQLDQLIVNSYRSSMALPDTKAEGHQGNRGNCSSNSRVLSNLKYLNADFELLKTKHENWGERTMTTKRILIVDDEVCVQEVVQACFEEIAGWEVVTASSAQEGLAKAAKEQPDAIILDVMMPGMDGIGFLQCLKTDPTIKSIPVVLLTAKADFTQPWRLAMLKVAGAIAKPFDPILLVEQVAEYLGW
jgi:CheY-like chemotaxis protein